MAHGICRGKMPNLNPANHEKVQAQRHHARLDHPWLFLTGSTKGEVPGGYPSRKTLLHSAHQQHHQGSLHHQTFHPEKPTGRSKDVKDTSYRTFVRPLMEYASTVWDPVGNKISQKKAGSWTEPVCKIRHWGLSTPERRDKARATMVYRIIDHQGPISISEKTSFRKIS